MKDFRFTNVADPSMLKKLDARDIEKKAEEAYGMTTRVGEPILPFYKERKKWYEAEIIEKSHVMIIHIFPNKYGLNDQVFMGKMRDTARELCIADLNHLNYLAEYIDEVDSFCVSFLNTLDGGFTAKKFMKDFYESFYRKLV